MKPSGSAPSSAYPGRRLCQFGVRRRSESHRSVCQELATSPRSINTWSIERSVRCLLIASPDWPAPMMTVVACRTILLRSSSVDGDEDIRRVGDDVEHRRPLLRLGDQRLDVIGARIGANVEVDADAAKAIANVVIH